MLENFLNVIFSLQIQNNINNNHLWMYLFFLGFYVVLHSLYNLLEQIYVLDLNYLNY